MKTSSSLLTRIPCSILGRRSLGAFANVKHEPEPVEAAEATMGYGSVKKGQRRMIDFGGGEGEGGRGAAFFISLILRYSYRTLTWNTRG